MNFPDIPPTLEGISDLINLLRGPNGCPWDKKQTANSLTGHLIEECYELVEAIEKKDYNNINEEIGDVILNVVYQIIFLKEVLDIDEQSIIKDLYAKIKIRHPHVFSDINLKNAADVEQNWEKIKDDSNVNLANNKDIPKYLPSLSLALKLQKKMPPQDINQSYDLIDSLLSNKDSLDSESLGKLLFAIVSIAKIKNIDPEKSLRMHNNYINKN
ncbi:MAG: MazG family protein [SAR202 cluster bacterium]|uniref:NTP pyrophosphohydrolase MazG-like domain-containing protein n=1 Tax=marine metagenome TaxID=408172 RepID=A0A382KQS7_9ZZZZ|nr:MazG family protein [SAR202 cluster bacterium]|tara:strand:+ start:354 stop:995 length:642 start_codon:yes stop_codon:yes gene_type:complete